MEKGKIWFENLSLHKKIVLITAVGLAGVCLVFYANIRYLAKYYEQELYEAHAQSLNDISTTITAEMQAIEAISDHIIGDSVIQDNLYELKDPEQEQTARWKRNVYQALYAYTFNSYVKSIHIVLKDGSNICMGNTDDLTAFDLEKLEEEAEKNKGKLKWEAPEEAGNSVVCYRQFSQQKYLTFEKLADVYLVVDIRKLIQDALEDNGYSTEESEFVLLERYRRIYPSVPCFDEVCTEVLETMQETGNAYLVAEMEGREKLIIQGEIPDTPWQYLYFKDYELIYRSMQRVKIRILVFMILVAALMVFVFWMVFRHVLKHLDFLIEKMQRFGEGRELPKQDETYHYETRQDEIGELHRNFDQMTCNVKTLRDENYEKQILLQEATIQMLQQQINPHFLYNTLDTINWMAQKYGVEEISVMAKSLGNLFRASIHGTDDRIPLAEELVVLDNYLRIQKIRFRDRLAFQMEVPDDISGIQVPKLCIQPLVENALKHALEYSDEICYIYVQIQVSGELCRIQVSNTGSQFAEDLFEKMEQGQLASNGSGVGLTNIHSRLKLLYGEQYGLRFYNDEDRAVVVLTIPQKRSDGYDEINDCG
ncbi:MAG: sensor histidine kinase [Eubacteriales bacterium]|nr:sensor histidine kinase [Eubacteriales bacterium]